MSEKPEYQVEISGQSAFDGQYCYLWIEKLWPSVTLKSRGSEMRHGYSLFPRGELVVKFRLAEEGTNGDKEFTVEQLADLLEQTIDALAPSFKCFVKIEDSQDTVREEKESDY